MKPIEAHAEMQMPTAANMPSSKAGDVPPEPQLQPPCGARRPSAVASTVMLFAARKIAPRVFRAGSAALLLILPACEVAVTRDVPATVLHVEGPAAAEAAQSRIRREIGVKSALTAGESLTTGPDAQVDVAVVPGALVHLEGDAELRLDAASISKNGNRVTEAMRRDVALTLPRGAAVFSVQFESERGGVSVATPQGALVISSPALCRVEVRNGATRITSARGSVRFQAAGTPAAATLGSRSFSEWPSGRHEPSPADFDVRATQEVEKSLEVEQKLLGLEHRRRLSPYPWRQ